MSELKTKLRRLDAQLERLTQKHATLHAERDQMIAECAEIHGQARLAAELGISRQRIHQIIERAKARS